MAQKMHDVVIVGAGPVGGALALALADADLDIVVLDARAAGGTIRGDRSLALSHGARLIFERLAIWPRLAAVPSAVTPIVEIDISQAGGFGVTRLLAEEQGVLALGYVVSYRALQGAIDDAMAHAGIAVRFGASATVVAGTPVDVGVELAGDAGETLRARLAVVADGAGTSIAGIARERRDYGQVALIAKVVMDSPHRGVAFERFTSAGPMALLPEGDHYGLVWTMTPEKSERVLALSDAHFLDALADHFGHRVAGFREVSDRRTFPLRLEFARPTVASRSVVIGNAAQALHPIAGQGFNLGVRDAYELGQAIIRTPRDALGERSMLAAFAARRRTDRYAGIAFTHGLTQLFAMDSPFVRWPRGLALTALDALPPLKRAFTRVMLYGLQ
ncbi:MAG: FAD-dependent monooxygenase [Betaproteobacteria bacterium]